MERASSSEKQAVATWMLTDDEILVRSDSVPEAESIVRRIWWQGQASRTYQHILYVSISIPSTSFPKMDRMAPRISSRRIRGHSDCLSSGLSVGGVEMTWPEASWVYLLVKLASLQNFKMCSGVGGYVSPGSKGHVSSEGGISLNQGLVCLWPHLKRPHLYG